MQRIRTIDGFVDVPSNPMDLQGPQWLLPRDADPGAAERQRRDEVAATAPAAATAWSLIATCGLRCQPILFAPDEVNAIWRGPAFPSAAAAVEYYARWPGHGCGVASGVQGAGDWSLACVWSRDLGAWRRFVIDHGSFELPNPEGSRMPTRTELRPEGTQTVIRWARDETGPPFTAPRTFPVTMGRQSDAQARAALLEARTNPSETWIVLPILGAATWKPHRLGDGLELRGPREPIPVDAKVAGYHLTVAGGLMRPETSSTAWCPPWLLDAMGVKIDG